MFILEFYPVIYAFVNFQTYGLTSGLPSVDAISEATKKQSDQKAKRPKSKATKKQSDQKAKRPKSKATKKQSDQKAKGINVLPTAGRSFVFASFGRSFTPYVWTLKIHKWI